MLTMESESGSRCARPTPTRPAVPDHTLAARPRATTRLVRTAALLGLLVVLLPAPAQAASCLYVSSYHPGYEWNDGIERGLEAGLAGRCELERFYMDTKRNTAPEHGAAMAEKAYQQILATRPDVVIACDDNASKYLVAPLLKETPFPVVFCGINWTVEPYGYPYDNVTGMIEVAPVQPMIKEMRTLFPGLARGVYLSSDVYTEHKDFVRYQRYFEEDRVTLRGVFVKTLAEWKAAYLAAQNGGEEFIVLGNNAGINDWDIDQAAAFALEHARIFSVSNYDWMMPYTMFALTKLPEEQGEWAGQVALAVLDGAPVSSIPIVVNRRWDIYINPGLLERGGFVLPPRLTQQAIKVGGR